MTTLPPPTSEIRFVDIRWLQQQISRVGQPTSLGSVTQQGETLGWRLSSIAPDSALGELGFHTDDVITALDGGLLTHDRIEAFFEGFAETPVIRTVSLVRDGRPLTLVFKVGKPQSVMLLSRSDGPELLVGGALFPHHPARAAAPPAPVTIPADARPVDRNWVYWLLQDMTVIAQQVRIVPAFKDGVATGFILFRLEPDSVLNGLGFRNGDIIRSLNGYDLTSPDNALAAYTQLRSAEGLVFTIEREHAQQQLVFKFVPGPAPDVIDNEVAPWMPSLPAHRSRYSLIPGSLTMLAPAGFAMDQGRLVYRGDHGFFDLLGLRAGDLVISVNGADASTLEAFTAALTQSARSNQVEIAVKREETVLRLTFDIPHTTATLPPQRETMRDGRPARPD